jgi:hypothetical protein
LFIAGCGDDAAHIQTLRDPWRCTFPGTPFTAEMIEDILTRSVWRTSAHIAGADALEGHTFELRFGETRDARCTVWNSSFFIATEAFLDGAEVPVWSGWREVFYVEPSETWQARTDPLTHQLQPITLSGGRIYSGNEIAYDLLFFPEFDDRSEIASGSYRFQAVSQ